MVSPDDSGDVGTQKDADRRLLDGSPVDRVIVFWEGGVVTAPLPLHGTIVVGRHPSCEVRVDHPTISRRHASLVLDESGVKLVDLGSHNGTRIGGHRVPPNEPVPIPHGTVVEIGGTMLTLQRGLLGTTPAAPSPAVEGPPPGIVVEDEAMKRLHRLVAMVAQGTISVLLLGETGVGKEVVAQTIHRRSPRSRGPFVSINCGALPDNLLESELFGHEKGAFTGAGQTKVGLLEAGHAGTVFLDEIGEMPLAAQVKLLRVLESKEIVRVGAVHPRPIDVRFVSATNRRLEEAIAQGTFREDLFYRLNGISIAIPPLRDRRNEIGPLAETLLSEGRRQLGRPPARLSPAARARLEQDPWPGNVRQLRNVIERAALLCPGATVEPEHLSLDAVDWGRATSPPSSSMGPPTLPMPIRPPLAPLPPNLSDELGEIERRRILDALDTCAGNQTRAAEMLGITRRVLMNRLEQYAIPRPRKR